ncbi:fructose PTS transporter subunit IIA [Clostridium bowmanii]|uniref:PTS sugar transporter subunit IIA n=1 Tax=Clostridium bowmanii TaxID=132925 RepID=UPI001C0AE34D|nr:PTS sugar transporter subunit IIA [Clostridium bowmanii]MBU3188262.1 fructose PTS transporter subunit IIA [Clostridium bowmanii]MCA1072648.1 fructose PTS transporter subunit IIA [Clostridium bowmanii]
MIIDEKLIILDLDVNNKLEAIASLSETAGKAGRLSDIDIYCQKVKKREDEVSTDMGFGIAIPHGKSDVVLDPFVVFAKLKKPIVWNEEENSKVNLIFMIGAPENSKDNVHLKILSQIAGKLMDEDFLNDLRNVTEKETVLNYFKSIII